MELRDINAIAKNMIATLVDAMGLDGEYYKKVNCNTPAAFSKATMGALGKYIAPDTRELNNLLDGSRLSQEKETAIRDKGLILINGKYREKKPSADMFVTVVHEMIHSNRNLLIRDAYRAEDISALNSNGNNLEQNTDIYSDMYADASQDIVKGSIDDSRKTIRKYDDMTEGEIDSDTVPGDKIDRQVVVDEALVDLMSALAFRLYRAKVKGEKVDIWDELEGFKGKDGDINYLAEIILKHKDLQLFEWMIDPITYSNGDIHYDFFSAYTAGDQELVEKLYKTKGLTLADDFGSILGERVMKADREADKKAMER